MFLTLQGSQLSQLGKNPLLAFAPSPDFQDIQLLIFGDGFYVFCFEDTSKMTA